MNIFKLLAVFLFLINAKANSEKTNVVSHVFCKDKYPLKDRIGKHKLEEVHTYAELKLDPISPLPDSFTICSSIMATDCQSPAAPIFFNLLDNNRQQWLAPWLTKPTARDASIDGRPGIDFSTWSKKGRYDKLPPMFPNQWVKSCLAVNTSSGSIDWVVEGAAVLSMTTEDMSNRKRIPKKLQKRLILGAMSFENKWFAVSSKVTNLNIFSTYFSIEKMENMIRDGSCVEEGDYLAWKDLEWTLHGEAMLETVERQQACEGQPLANLYYAPFPRWDSCMHHCENVGTKALPVDTAEQWDMLQNFLKAKVYDRARLAPWTPRTCFG